MDPNKIGVKEAKRLRNAPRARLNRRLVRVIFGVHAERVTAHWRHDLAHESPAHRASGPISRLSPPTPRQRAQQHVWWGTLSHARIRAGARRRLPYRLRVDRR